MKDVVVKPSQPRFLTALLTVSVIAVIIVWAVTALTNEDPLWFLHRFDARAEALVIYWDGQTITLHPGDQGFDAVMDAFAEAVSQPAGFEWQVALSEQSIDTYRSKARMLEVRFAEPVQVHTRHPFLEAATYLIPLDGTHAQWRRVFAFPGYVPYTSGPIDASPTSFDALVQATETAVTTNVTAQAPN